MRPIMILVAAALIGLCVWAVLRLLIDVFMLVGRGLRSALFGCCSSKHRGPGVHVRARNVRMQAVGDRVAERVSHRVAERMAHRAPPPPAKRCVNPKCQWVNRPPAQFCAQCGRPLPKPRRTA